MYAYIFWGVLNRRFCINKCKWMNGREKERKEERKGRREGRKNRLGQKSLTTRPGLSVLLLSKFHKICPWLHLL